jgi:hypothetical protein
VLMIACVPLNESPCVSNDSVIVIVAPLLIAGVAPTASRSVCRDPIVVRLGPPPETVASSGH